MTKTLEQIQQENRKFILEANYGTFEEALNNTNLSINIKGNYRFLPLTLSRVLLALKDKKIGFYWDSLGYIVSAGQDYGYYKEDEVEYICDWDLTKETLEEQSEETQRRINKLFNN